MTWPYRGALWGNVVYSRATLSDGCTAIAMRIWVTARLSLHDSDNL